MHVYLSALRVLMWKHVKERTRRLSHTLFELCSGIIVFVILLMLKALSEDTSPESPSNVDEDYHSIDSTVLYSPGTDSTHHLMQKLAKAIEDDELTADLNVKKYLSFQTEHDMMTYLYSNNITEPVFTVNFKDLSLEHPRKLNYIIGFTGVSSQVHSVMSTLFSDSYYSQVESTASLGNFQWVLDKVYLEIISGDNVTSDVQIHLLDDMKSGMKIIHKFLILCTIMAPLPFFLFKASKLVYEKRSGLKELMKLVGVSPNLLRISHLLDTLSLASIYATVITIILKVPDEPVLPKTNPVIIAITMMMHLTNLTSLAFVTSSLSQDYQHSDTLSLLIYLCTFILDNLWYRKVNVLLEFFLCCLLPHGPVYLFWDEVIFLENIGEGAAFNNMFSRSRSKCTPLVLVWVFFIAQFVIIMTVAWYLEMVRPGRYGIAAKWNFFIAKKFWRRHKKSVSFHVTVERNLHVLRDDRYFEKPPLFAEIAVKVVRLTKIFEGFKKRRVIALDSVTLDAYRGEITILLGTNGAGKSTLLSVIAGMYSANTGTVYVNGMDNMTRFQEIRKDLGFSPQSDITFSYLTLRENIEFFGRLRGEHEQVHTSAVKLMERLQLTSKADYYSHQVSYATRRCLQLACALVGDADVLVLDEPTSGMDEFMKHSVWDLLLLMRGQKTIIMTTMDMEEADALADRIALVHHGKLKCHGSPAFLKDAIGTEFNLTITLKRNYDINAVHELIAATIPEVTLYPHQEHSASFGLPAKDREQFPILFDTLEEMKQTLGITNMNVGMSMEQVFLRFIEEEDEIPISENGNETADDVTLKKWRLWKQQFVALVERGFTFLWTKKLQFLILQVLVPIVGLMVATLSTNSVMGASLGQDVSNDPRTSTVMFYDLGPYRNKDIKPWVYSPEVETKNSENVLRDAEKLVNTPDRRTHQVFGYKIKDKNNAIIYSTPSQYLITKAVNVFSNVFQTAHMPYFKDHKIIANYRPLYLGSSSSNVIRQPKSLYLCIAWAMWVAFMVTIPLAPLVILPIEEYRSGIRFNLILSGCSPLVFWFSKLVANSLVYLLIVPGPVVLITAFLDYDNTLNQAKFLYALLLILVMYGPTFLLHLYVLSFFLHPHHALCIIYVMELAFGLLSPLFIYCLFLGGFWSRLATYIAVMAIHISPGLAFTIGLTGISVTARANAYCKLNRHLCPNHIYSDLGFDKDICCSSKAKDPFDYYVSFESGMLQISVLLMQFIFYLVILLLLQNRVLQNCLGHMITRHYKEPLQAYKNHKVQEEIVYVKKKMNKLKDKDDIRERQTIMDEDMILVENVHKLYLGLGLRCNAVKGVSFAVKKGECLGILGSSGAGKTSLLRAVAGMTVMTRGNANVNGYFVREHRKKYLERTALTRSSGAFDTFLTGYDNLALYSALHGRPASLIGKQVLRHLYYMDLQSFSDVQVGQYSSGCYRRLAVCAAMLATPLGAFIDEPTTGVDPHSRPLVTRALRRLLDSGTACVVTEAGMDWRQMESVFTRIAILSGGQFAAIGPANEIRDELASGYSATIKLRVKAAYIVSQDADSDSIQSFKSIRSVKSERSCRGTSVYNTKHVEANTFLNSLKFDFKLLFETSELREEHLSLLYYHIRDETKKLLFSDMFNKLEYLKSKYDHLIEDYNLSETSIQEIFSRLERT